MDTDQPKTRNFDCRISVISWRENWRVLRSPRWMTPDIAFHESEYQRLRGELQVAHEESHLPELPSDETRVALNDLLIRIRLKSINPL